MQFTGKKLPDGRNYLYAWFSAMFTRIDLVLISVISRNDLEAIAQVIETEIRRIESYANKFNPESELSRINRLAGSQEVIVTEEMMRILAECEMLNKRTLGFFDISAGSEIHGLTVKYLLNTDKSTIKFAHSDVKIDLSGYIKGFALRNVSEILNISNITDALINIGNSSVFAKGNHPFGEGWKIQIPDVFTEWILCNECLTTSGNKPHTNWPIVMPDSGMQGTRDLPVSVITADGAEGEAVAKAVYLASENEVKKILDEFDARVI